MAMVASDSAAHGNASPLKLGVQREVYAIVAMAEICKAGCAEPVIVMNRSPNIKVEPILVSEVFSSVGRANHDFFPALPHPNTRGDRIVSLQCVIPNDGEIFKPIIGVQQMADGPSRVASGKMTYVANINMGNADAPISQDVNPGWPNSQISALSDTSIPCLREGKPCQQAGSDEKQPGERGYRITKKILIDDPQYGFFISIIVGLFCCAVGLTLNSHRARLRRLLGFCLFALGLFTPIFPWWALIFLVF